MKSARTFLVIAAVSLLSASGIHTTQPASAAIGFGPTPGTPSVSSAVPYQVVDITDVQAKQLALRFLGPDAVAHMVYRVRPSAADQPQMRPNTANSSSFVVSPNTTNKTKLGPWAGYDVDLSGTGRTATGTDGIFNVAPNTSTDTVTWVGVGGNYGNLLQAGVDQFSMQGFYTLCTTQSCFDHNLSVFPVAAGDSISAAVYQVGTGLWYVNLLDYRSNKYYPLEVAFYPDQTSAEWIVEDMGQAAANFGSVTFQNSWWTYTGSSSQPITSSAAGTLWKMNEQVPGGSYGYICPGPIGADGESFALRPSSSLC